MNICRKCGKKFPNYLIIDGEKRNLCSRKYCLECSPWKMRNTKKLENYEKKECLFCGEKIDKGLRCKKCLYLLQNERWKQRKRKVIKLMGGCCCKCGYNKNINVFDLHHLEPKEKEYHWERMKKLKWNSIIQEIKKCILVCSNCHREIHSTEEDFILEGTDKDNFLLNHEVKATGICFNPECDNPVYETKYCCVNCHTKHKRIVKNRPSKEQLRKDVDDLGYKGAGRKYGVSDNSIRKWIKVDA